MSLREDLKAGTVRLNALPSDKRNRVKRFLSGDKRALQKRDKVLGLRFSSEDIAKWHKAADKADETITDWIERILNAAAE